MIRWLSSSWSGRPSESRIRSAVSTAACGSWTSSSRIANSSPPNRAAVSAARTLARDALGDLEQDPVADGVTEAVVDGLEVIEIDEQHGHPDAVAQRPRDRVADALVEQRPVGEMGDRIVEGLVGELLLERLALRDVAAVEHDPADRAVTQQVGVEDLEVAQAAVLVREQAIDHLGAAARAGAIGEAA